MKKMFFFLSFSILLFSHNIAYAKFPVHLGGFTLGDDIENYKTLVDTKTCRKVLFNRYLKECEIILRPEFKSGIITYGLCDRPNKILKIKLKFADASKKNYKQILSRYKKQFGQPDEYKGDAFKTVIAWKWSFTNNNNERISLILQYNEMNEEEKIGVAVKLTLTSQVEKERACFMADSPDKTKKLLKPKLKGKALWDLLVPY